MFNLRNKYAFSLIEVLIVVAITGVSIIVIFNTFNISMRALSITRDYYRANILLSNKITKLFSEGLESDTRNFVNFDEPFENFSWKLLSQKITVNGGNLKQISLTVQLPQTSNYREINITTYLNK